MSLLDTNGWRYVTEIDIGQGVKGSAYVLGEVRAIVSRDPIRERGIIVMRWHISVSCADRYPTWEEIKAARYVLVPDAVFMAQILPPRADYVNMHPNTFHLHEIPEEIAR